MKETNRTEERFIVLAREAGERVENLRRVLEPLGVVEVVVDREVDAGLEGLGALAGNDERDRNIPSPVWIPDEEAVGFGGMMSNSGSFPWVTAWSRGLCHVARTLREDEAVWFVEDDVAGDAEGFRKLVEGTVARRVDLAAWEVRTREEDARWPYWNYADGFFSRPARGFQPLCRLSGRLLRAVLDCQEINGRCAFHEVMFPSVAREQGMSWLSWNGDAELRRCFGEFRFRPEVSEVMNGVSHPVKDEAVHAAIMSLTGHEFSRMAEANLEGWSILADDYRFLVRYCRERGIRRVVEFGPGDSTLAFLDAGCEVLSFDHDEAWLQKARDRFTGEAGVSLAHCPEGTLPNAETLPFEPDLVMVDGPPFREGQAMSRIGPCEWALEHCGHFILHDAKRAGEQATLAEMERRGMQVTRIPTKKGLAVVVDPGRVEE